MSSKPAGFKSAHFPGGVDSLQRYIVLHGKYPQVDVANNIQGRVSVRVMIDEKGYVSDPVILRGIADSIDDEVLHVMNNMPCWKPATYNGRPTKELVALLINFRLE